MVTDLKTSQEDPVSDLSLADMIRVALAGGGNARATIGQIGDAVASMITGGTELRGLTFTSDTGSTADSDPGNGLFKWNHATQGSATVLYFDNLTADGVSTATLFASLASSGYLYLQDATDATKWQEWKWTAVTAGSGYYKFTVTLEANAGSIPDNVLVMCDFESGGAGAASPTTTKGDLIVRSASADSRLPVGADGYALVADSAQTLGVKWTAPGNAFTAVTQAQQSHRFLQRDGTWRDPTLVSLGTFSIGTPATITDDTKYNSWPDVCRIRGNKLMTLYAKGDAHALDATNDAVCKIGAENSDGTITWGSEIVVHNDVSNFVSVAGISQMSTGRIIAVLLRGPGNTTGAGIVYSDDGGATWSSYIDLNSGFTQVEYGAGRAVELPNGEILVPVEGVNTGDTAINRWSKVVRSTDGGLTWGSPVTVRNYSTDTRPYYESDLGLLPDDSLLILHRCADGAPGTVYTQRSTDGGLTWSAPVLAFNGYAKPSWTTLSDGAIIAMSRDNSTKAVIAYMSLDNGVTWGSAVTIDGTMYESEYAYPVELTDGRVLIVYGFQVTSATTNSDIKGVVLTMNRRKLADHVLVNAQTGTSYTYLYTDRDKLVTHSNASAIAGTLPQATGFFTAGWSMWVQNRGVGTLTITPTTSTIDGSATLVLTTGQGALIASDGTNYFTMRGVGAVSSRTPSIQSVTSAATVTPTFSDDLVKITAQAAGLTLANPTGTAIDGLGMTIRIKDNGTARSISTGSQYRSVGVTIPPTTVVGKTLYLGMIYNADDTKWDVVSVAQEA